MTQSAPYQFFAPLPADQRAALKADIAKRGILVPVEMDGQTGEVLDGHHRMEIAAELGIVAPTIARTFDSEHERVDHILKINLLRRHMDAISWAQGFRRLAEERGIRLGKGKGDPSGKTATAAVLAAELGVSERTARSRLSLLDAPVAVQEGVRDHAMSEREARHVVRREQKRANHAPDVVEQPESSSPTTFAAIVADPPWRYGNTATRGSAEDHYPTMAVEDICALAPWGRAMGDVARADSHLYLWATNSLLREAFAVAEAWGFTYKTLLTWVKPQIGLGNYFRGRTEHVLFCTRGTLPTLRRDVSNVIEAPRAQHSRKPDCFYDLVESQSPGPYLELFCRRRRLGWSAWGNEA